jgi:hypothetical protein
MRPPLPVHINRRHAGLEHEPWGFRRTPLRKLRSQTGRVAAAGVSTGSGRPAVRRAAADRRESAGSMNGPVLIRLPAYGDPD